MPYLEFYKKENTTYATFRLIYFSDENSEKIIRKLARHFKINIQDVRFRGKKESGFACWNDNSIRLCHYPNIVLICHETAHHYENQKYNNKRHDKQLARTVKKILNYCMRKKYWNLGKGFYEVRE